MRRESPKLEKLERSVRRLRYGLWVLAFFAIFPNVTRVVVEVITTAVLHNLLPK